MEYPANLSSTCGKVDQPGMEENMGSHVMKREKYVQADKKLNIKWTIILVTIDSRLTLL